MNYKLTLGWLYPDLMSIYGDRGNVIVLQKRCKWRGITMHIREVGLESSLKDLESCDMLLMGGAQDRQQTIVAKDLWHKKNTLQQMIESEIPGIYICGGYQFLGKYYKEADGTIIDQLGLLDFYTENPGETVERSIGNIAIESAKFTAEACQYVGFENHGGRTYLGEGLEPLGKVIKGAGNNGQDKGEGLLYKNTIGTYMHGPILPKNPEITDWLIARALERKFHETSLLKQLDDELSYKAREVILKRILTG